MYLDVNSQVINTYCYIMSTFTLPRALAGDVGRDVAAPGVGAYDSRNDAYTVKVSRYLDILLFLSTGYLDIYGYYLLDIYTMFPSQAYYQWVPFVLFLQAGLFYAPHLLCKSWEGGKVKGGWRRKCFLPSMFYI